MARFLYGGGGDGDIIKPTGVPFINAVASIYNARTGGTQVTDLQNASGAGIATVTTDAFGQAIFYGPDNFIGVLWLDFGTGVRWGLAPKDVAAASNRAIAVQRASDATTPSYTTKAHLPYNAADPLEQNLTTTLDPLVIPRFASQSARDAAFPSPVNGDRCYRTDLSAEQVYSGPLGLWRTTAFPLGYGSNGTSVTVANTTAETALTTLVIPAGYATPGATFRLTAFGLVQQAFNTTPNITFRVRVGGVGGTSMGANTYTAASNASPTDRPWRLVSDVTVVSTGTSGTWFGSVHSTSNITSTTALTTTQASMRTDGVNMITRSTTVDQQMTLTVQWDTASIVNTVTMFGWYFERMC